MPPFCETFKGCDVNKGRGISRAARRGERDNGEGYCKQAVKSYYKQIRIPASIRSVDKEV